MSHLHWIVLNDGVDERVTEDDVDPVEEAAVIDRVLIPITNSEIGMPRGSDSGYTAIGEVSGKFALVSLFDEGAQIAVIAVCLHSRASRGVWTRIIGRGAGEIVFNKNDCPPETPWCAVRCIAPEPVLPSWFDHWTKTLAMAILRREGW